jgi:uncharacterized membrane protein
MTENTPDPNATQKLFSVDEPASSGAPAPSSNDTTLAGLAYLTQFVVPAVMPIILLVSEDSKRSAFVRHHAVQSLGLMVAAVVYEIAAAIGFTIISVVLPCLSCVLWLVFLLPIAPFLYYGVLAFQGKQVDIPYLSAILRQNKWL